MVDVRMPAPTPPGGLGQSPPVDAVRGYLGELLTWVTQTRRELDSLDAAALRSADPDSYTGDVVLAMALWQAASDRSNRLQLLWDNGRADSSGREQMMRVVWSRAEPAALGSPTPAGSSPSAGTPLGSGGGLAPAMTLPETCRLTDALATQLRARLSFDPRAAEAGARIAAVRAGIERLRELVVPEPTWAPQVTVLAARADDLAVRAARGADIETPLTDLEADAARCERDLIVRTASARQRERDAVQAVVDLKAEQVGAGQLRDRLVAREQELEALVAECVAKVTPAPRPAVPEVSALGPVPADAAGLAAYRQRLGDVERAMDQLEKIYQAPLGVLDELTQRFEAYRIVASRAVVRGGAAAEPVRAAMQAAETLVRQRPCPVTQASEAVTAFQAVARGTTDQTTGDAGSVR